MELRHLRYFLAVGEALNFTKAAAQLRVAQPALSRQVQDLEDEIGVDLMKRSPRGVTLTAEGKLFLDEVRELLKRADESVEKVRALARGEDGTLHRILDRVFAAVHAKPRIAVECDSASSLITEVEAGRGVALSSTIFKLVAGKRLLYRPLTGTTEVASVGIARASKGDVTPAGEKFCEILRKISNVATVPKSKAMKLS